MNEEQREQQMMAAADRYADEVCDEFHTGAEVAETINDFCAGWREADQHPHWIPIEEMLPKESEEVLAYNLLYNEKYLCTYHNGKFEDYLGELGKGAVSHWMPIVPPRKEEKK